MLSIVFTRWRLLQQSETEKLLSSAGNKSFIVFPEDRMHPIKMQTYLPQRWIKRGMKDTFTDTASRGEYLAFQLGVYALQDLQNLHINFSDLKSKTGKTINAKHISCLNTNGTDYKEEPLVKVVNVKPGVVQSMWCAVDVPVDATPGIYTGKATVLTAGQTPQSINITLHVIKDVLKDGGISNPEKQTRLKWLNSTLAQENTVIAPYTPLQVGDTSVSLLGRKVLIGKTGFPAQIQTFFTPEMTSVSSKENNILTEPMHFHFIESKSQKI
ncbi:DUF6067 family protein [Niabella ginsengisoli]|uniref:DUF6067 family protein n=1 Tax=Niabella ginsengisoli TaxID=522298 RepID=A0ABS9SMG1_9BACT|nr:glycoside hydrolase domain-containing protein [Niabella ginsengisoli]MCH5599344.1 DUF6067 family protein [Niabella ginsengisoli]